MSAIRNLWRAVRARLRAWWDSRVDPPRRAEPPRYRTERTDEVPEAPIQQVLYVVGEGEHEWYAVMACPCGCGDTLVMSLLAEARPRWRVSVDPDGVPSLSPSVHRRVGCGSHFFLRDGRIAWCPEPPGWD